MEKPLKRKRRLSQEDVSVAALAAGIDEEAAQRLLAQLHEKEIKEDDMDDQDADDLPPMNSGLPAQSSQYDAKLPGEITKLKARMANVEHVTTDLSREMSKNTVTLIPKKKASPKELHAHDSTVVAEMKRELGANYAGFTTSKKAAQVKVREFLNPKAVVAQITKALGKIPDRECMYKVGPTVDISMTKLSQPAHIGFKALLDTFDYNRGGRENTLKVKRIYPIDTQKAEWHIEYKGDVIMYGCTSVQHATSKVVVLESVNFEGVSVRGEDLEEALEQLWNEKWDLEVTVQPSSVQGLPRAPLRGEKGSGKAGSSR